jgi:hypothetical protein
VSSTRTNEPGKASPNAAAISSGLAMSVEMRVTRARAIPNSLMGSDSISTLASVPSLTKAVSREGKKATIERGASFGITCAMISPA